MTYAIPHIANHESAAVARLVQQFSRDGGVAAMVRLFARRTQTIEDALYAFLAADALETAEGDQLDVLGGIVGQPRNGHTDAEYRLRIRVRVKVNQSSGTGPELIEIAKLLLQGAEVHFVRYQPASYALSAVGATSIGAELASILIDATAGGVRPWITWSEFPANETLTLNSSTAGTRLNEGELGHARSN